MIATGVQPSLRAVLASMGFDGKHPSLRFADSFETALASLRWTDGPPQSLKGVKSPL